MKFHEQQFQVRLTVSREKLRATMGQLGSTLTKLRLDGDDLLLGHHQERGVDPEPAYALDTGLGRQVGQGLEGSEVLGATVGVARVIYAVGTDVNIKGTQGLGPGEGQGGYALFVGRLGYSI